MCAKTRTQKCHADSINNIHNSGSDNKDPSGCDGSFLLLLFTSHHPSSGYPSGLSSAAHIRTRIKILGPITISHNEDSRQVETSTYLLPEHFEEFASRVTRSLLVLGSFLYELANVRV